MIKSLRILCAALLVIAFALPNLAPAAAAEPEVKYLLLSELPVGSQVIEPNRVVVHVTGDNMTPVAGDVTQSIVWRIVAKNHAGYPDNSVTLLSEYLIGKKAYDQSGSSRWQSSEIRTWLNNNFMFYIGTNLQNAILPTSITTSTKYDADGNWHEDNLVRTEVTEEKVFLPRWAEVADLNDNLVLEYFQGAPAASRIADFPGNTDGTGLTWITRQEVTGSEGWVLSISALGDSQQTSVSVNSRGIRPMLNVRDDILVTAQPNSEGYYEIVEGELALTNDSDIDGVYFAGDTLSFDFYNLEPNDDIRVVFYVRISDESYVSAEVITGLSQDGDLWYMDITTDDLGRSSISGEVNSGLPAGQVRIDLLGRDEIEKMTILKNSSMDLSVVVLDSLTFGDIVLSSNQPDNLFDFNALVTLELPGVGSVTFDPGIPAAYYIEMFFEAMGEGEDWISIGYDDTEKIFSIWVDSVNHTFLSGQAATIRFEDVAAKFGVTGMTAANFLDYLDFRVYDNEGALVEDFNSYFNPANVTYDPVNDILTIPVNHFSGYEVALSDTPSQPELPDTGTNTLPLILLTVLLIAGGLLLLKRQLHAQ